ncbi:hypothetical protein QJQ45_007035 [Haematococcus lacustris]|nr:hypothetical protein QJQ45_007035 [Haematococcus lacustris]
MSLSTAVCPASFHVSQRFGAARQGGRPIIRAGTTRATVRPDNTWSRPMPDRDADFVRPSYVPGPSTYPEMDPRRQQEVQPLYRPPPEFKPAELPEKSADLPSGPTMPERRRDDVPAGTPKEKPGKADPDTKPREAPAEKPKEAPSK